MCQIHDFGDDFVHCGHLDRIAFTMPMFNALLCALDMKFPSQFLDRTIPNFISNQTTDDPKDYTMKNIEITQTLKFILAAPDVVIKNEP